MYKMEYSGYSCYLPIIEVVKEDELGSKYAEATRLVKYSLKDHRPTCCNTICLGHPSVYRGGSDPSATDPGEGLFEMEIAEDGKPLNVDQMNMLNISHVYEQHKREGDTEGLAGVILAPDDHFLYCTAMEPTGSDWGHFAYFKEEYKYDSSAYVGLQDAKTLAIELGKILFKTTIDTPEKVFQYSQHVDSFRQSPDIHTVQVIYGPVIYREDENQWIRDNLVRGVYEKTSVQRRILQNYSETVTRELFNFVKPVRLQEEHEFRFCVGLGADKEKLLRRDYVFPEITERFAKLFRRGYSL